MLYIVSFYNHLNQYEFLHFLVFMKIYQITKINSRMNNYL
jgi:hypothetical protein